MEVEDRRAHAQGVESKTKQKQEKNKKRIKKDS